MAGQSRLEAYVIDSETGCWNWCDITQGGYGRVRYKDREEAAHRAVYEALIGPIPTGLNLDHLCRNRRCVNPEHLEAVTQRENLLRGETFAAQNASKTHCKHGHPFTPENCYQRPSGGRDCRTCMQKRNEAYLERKEKGLRAL